MKSSQSIRLHNMDQALALDTTYTLGRSMVHHRGTCQPLPENQGVILPGRKFLPAANC